MPPRSRRPRGKWWQRSNKWGRSSTKSRRIWRRFACSMSGSWRTGRREYLWKLRRGSPSLWFSAARAHHHEDLGEVDYEIAMPALFRTPHAHWIYVTEADVDGRYAGAHLRLTDSDSGILSVQLPDSPLGRFPGQPPGGSRSPARI